MSELKETKKIKVVKLHEWTPKQFLSPTLNTKIAQQGPKKLNNPKIKSKSNVRIKETKKMKIIALYEQTQKQFEPDPNLQNSLCFAPKKLKKEKKKRIAL